jgi:hypothetical protein
VAAEPETGLITDCEMTMAAGKDNTDAAVGVKMTNGTGSTEPADNPTTGDRPAAESPAEESAAGADTAATSAETATVLSLLVAYLDAVAAASRDRAVRLRSGLGRGLVRRRANPPAARAGGRTQAARPARRADAERERLLAVAEERARIARDCTTPPVTRSA